MSGSVELLSEVSRECRQVIVTGATGFVGRHLIPSLLERNYEVVAIARDEEKAKRFSWYRDTRFCALDFHEETPAIDIGKGASLIHLAWPGLPNYNAMFHLEENLPRAYEFVKAMIAAGVSRVLVSGTCQEYGHRSGPIASTAPTNPTTPYALAKDSLRRHLGFLQAQAPFTLQWARLFYMYGDGQHPNAILAQLDSAIDRGDAAFNMSGGEQLRDYLPVQRAARQLLSIFEKATDGVFNVCSGAPISIRRLVEQRIAERAADIKMNLGCYPYPTYEPLAFWGINDIEGAVGPV